ncbi:MAG: DUF4126 family protein [Candidatus Sulfotelmatobacter sp.]
MTSTLALLLAFGIGVVAGVRSLTAPAVVAWAAHLGWINLHGSPLAFMGSKWSVGIFTVLALVELVADQLPSTSARTAAVGLSARIVTGGLCGACLAVAGGAALLVGALAGAIGGIAGAFGGYHARVGLVRSLRVPDVIIAVSEDVVAIALGLFLVSRF